MCAGQSCAPSEKRSLTNDRNWGKWEPGSILRPRAQFRVASMFCSSSVFGRLFFDVIDDQDGHRALAFFELQPKLFADCILE